FERICAVLQKTNSNYDTDIFYPLINEIVKLSKIKIEKDLPSEAKEKSEEIKIPTRVIADHIRALTFAIAEGAVPGNEGRGYVLRRILRRAARYGRKINLNDPFLYLLVDTLAQTMGDVFPEIKEKKEYVKKVIKGEEESFNATLDRGIELFEEIIERLNKKKEKLIPGEDVFKLYDTFGFPVDLTNIMAIEKGFSIDEVKFNELMNQQKKSSRDASKDKFASVSVLLNDTKGFNFSSDTSTDFTGYDELSTASKITGFKRDGETDLIVLNKSPFYVEAGGQVDDTGLLIINENKFDVVDLLKVENKIIHVVDNDFKKVLQPGVELTAEVDSRHRWDVMRNHSVTHFLHASLRKILGTHVQQAGSYVGPDHLRFDFTHFTKPSSEELHDIEILVNEQLRRNLPMYHHRNIPFEEAKKMGALMFFGDKYGDKVNVVQFGDFTMEFCGGTHVKNSSEIGLFKITSEASIASGVRRIEAVTGAGVQKYIQSQLEHMKQFSHRIDELLDTKKKLEKEISDLKLKEKLGQLDHILSLHSEEKGIKVFKGRVHADNMDELKSFGDEMRNKMGSGVGVLISQVEDKVGIVAVVSDDLIKEKKLSAGKIVGELAKLVGGGGGGRPHLATAGGKDVLGIPAALSKVEKVVASLF
ncbi:MAG: alanine--tRNA ligase, partial [Ignavibacteriaceae bacterium]|nr:alanine--tRNA ligase [Ignavibacteriaceae bacterium]